MKYLYLISLLVFSMVSTAQVAVNTTGANGDPSSMLDVSASNKGALIPRLTSVQRKAIASPAVGLLVYDTDKQTIFMFDGQLWRALAVTAENNLAPVQRKGDGEYINAHFGQSVAMHGNYAIVGAPGDTVNGVTTGTAYIFYKDVNGWQKQTKLFASNGAGGDQFGYSVDIFNDIAVVGAPYKTISGITSRGRVYVFKRTGHVWNQVVGLQASNGAQGDNFGWSVAIHNNILVASAPFRDHSNHENAGSVYPFAFSNGAWQPRGVINLSITSDNAQFGYAVDFWGNTLVAGSYYELANGIHSGVLYTYTTNSDGTLWVNGQKLIPNVQSEWMHFGVAVAIKGDVIVAGAPSFSSQGQQNAGAWFSFKRVNGVWQTSSTHLSQSTQAEMGSSVAIDGEWKYAGADEWESGKGRVMASKSHGEYIYNPDPYVHATFGRSVAADNGQYIVGAPLGAGSVFFGTKE